jgi:hypothetical protein
MVDVAAHPEDCDRATCKETIGVIEDGSGDQQLAVRRRRQLKKQTQGGGVSCRS